MTPVHTAPAPARDDDVPAGLRLPAEADRPGAQSVPRAAASAPSSTSKSALLESAYVEYVRRREGGEPPHIEAHCARFAPCRSSLRRLLQAYEFVAVNPDYMANRLDECLAQAGGRHGDLTLLRELGRGSFARVYLATEASAGDRLMAVKLSLGDGAEARTQGRLLHPNIVPVWSAGVEESTGLQIVRMPYLGSATLEDVLDGAFPTPKAPPPRKASVILDALRSRAQPEDPPAERPHARLQQGSYADGVIHLAIQMAEALAFLHGQGVCHRDLKPSNVLLDPSAKPLLLDFNLSASAHEIPRDTGGTLRYMAPEHIRAYLSKNPDGLDERADLFALGVIVYELLTGDHPYGPIPAELTGPELAQFLMERMKGDFRPLRGAYPGLARPVAAVLDRCLASDPADRPAGAAALVAELKRQFAPARRIRRWVAIHRLLVGTALCLFALTAAAAGYAGSAERQFRLGKAAYDDGDYDAAEKHFDRAVRRDPDNTRYRRARGCARLQQSKFLQGGGDHKLRDKLDQVADDLISDERSPDTLAVWAYVFCRMQNNSNDDAIGMYKQLAEKAGDPPPVMVLNNRAYAYFTSKKEDKYERAQNDLNRAATLDLSCQAVFYNRALIVLHQSLRPKKPSLDFADALKDIERAVQLGPATPALYRDAAQLYALAAAGAQSKEVRRQRAERALHYMRELTASGYKPNAITLRLFRPLPVELPPAEPDLKPEKDIPFRELRLIDPVVFPD